MLKKLLMLTVLVITAFSFSTETLYAKSVSELQKQKSNVQNDKKSTQQKLAETKEEKSAALAEVETIDQELDKVTNDLEIINVALDETTALLAKTEEELKVAEAEREEQYELLKKRLRYMYEHGNAGYLNIILKADNFGDFFNRLEYVNRIATYDKDIFTALKATEETIVIKVDETQRQKKELQVLSAEQISKKQSLDKVLNEKQLIVANLNANEEKYTQMINDLDKASKSIEALIKKAQEESAKAASIANPYSGGKLAWPIPASSRITSNYGWRTSPKKEFHTGVDVGVPTGNNIVAAEAGVVIASESKGGYGLTVIIDHGGSLSTLYGHNSKLLVKVGQTVKRGEVIAKSGNTGYSTGPHCHFEVRVKGAHVNPMNYLR